MVVPTPTVPAATLASLEERARQLRRHVIRMIAAAGSGHPGGSLSAAEIVTALYFHVMRHDPARPHWADRDRFVLSKGHGVPIVYAALAEAGYFPTGWLETLRKLGSPLQGHPSRRDCPGIEASTGSLGQGLSIAAGMALAGKLDGKDYRVFVLLGDGEIQEGQIWEAAMFAGHHRLDNLIAILDYNRYQLDDAVEAIVSLEPVADKWRAFGWDVEEIDGHDLAQVVPALERARAGTGRPVMIIAHTVKGKGVSFMENNNEFHGRAPTPEETEKALAELAVEAPSSAAGAAGE
ncbi:transketolase [Thermaerobacter marianensis]|uniref:transketolase n=1 Tax=Thermaerobacter marianensis TaxID=73919 RepID=UPI0005A97CCB